MTDSHPLPITMGVLEKCTNLMPKNGMDRQPIHLLLRNIHKEGIHKWDFLRVGHTQYLLFVFEEPQPKEDGNYLLIKAEYITDCPSNFIPESELLQDTEILSY